MQTNPAVEQKPVVKRGKCIHTPTHVYYVESRPFSFDQLKSYAYNNYNVVVFLNRYSAQL